MTVLGALILIVLLWLAALLIVPTICACWKGARAMGRCGAQPPRRGGV